MPSINVITRTGTQHTIAGEVDISVMETLKEAGVGDILATCGGMCSCATCHVYVAPGFETALSPMSGDEDDLLDSSDHRQVNSRLSCQIKLASALDGLTVTVAPED